MRSVAGGVMALYCQAPASRLTHMNKILISACLAGFNVRYNGTCKTSLSPLLAQWQNQGRLVYCCPELAAGFGTPRPPAEIIAGAGGSVNIEDGARVREMTGRDVTEPFMLGAHLTLNIAQRQGCRFALLTDGSPSCGSQVLHTGEFNGQTRNGYGVTAYLLRRHGIAVFSHRQMERLIECVLQAE